jgi:sucrose phosphorylase
MLTGVRAMLAVRRNAPGFSPFAAQEVDFLDDRVLVVRRAAATEDEVVAVVNVSDEVVVLASLSGTDLLTGARYDGLRLEPFGYVWLVSDAGMSRVASAV